MFKLESYITPLLMGYIDKYVKLKTEDFQLSLWGGDAVLGKLDLRLDVIERALMLPITFKSGFIHELRIHVPWTRIYSEPVVITINTIECIVKMRDSAHDSETDSVQSNTNKRTDIPPNRSAKQLTALDGEELPPGYLQSLLNKILHNLNIVVNNLILKFVEDDIVLSLNIKSGECYSVGGDWNRSFIELSLPELVLRRVVDFHDLTLCLDRRNASGRIESYQDPILYRCSLTCRFYMRYENLSAKLPFITKLNVLCEKFDMSLTDNQLPMFCRLIELCLALYYGTFELPGATPQVDVTASAVLDRGSEFVVPVQEVDQKVATDDQPGWMSWAWSYVPQITSSDEMINALEIDSRRLAKRVELTILDIGVYIMKASIVFKLSDQVQDSSYFGATKTAFLPLMRLDAHGIGLEATMRGISYFDLHFGISSIRLLMSELEELARSSVEFKTKGKDLPGGLAFLTFGDVTDDGSEPKTEYMSGSLFDSSSAENNGKPTIYIFDELKHSTVYTETYALSRFGAFWMDYMFTMKDIDTEDNNGESSTDASTATDKSILENLDLHEKATLTFLFGPVNLTVSSHMVDCVLKFYECMYNHEYEPYTKPKTETVKSNPRQRRPPTEEELSQLEEYIPIRTMDFNFLHVTVIVEAASQPKGDVSKKLFQSRKHKRKSKQSAESSVVVKSTVLPGAVLEADRVEIQMCSPMYAKSMAKACSLLSSPSEHIMYHCHSHLNIKSFNVGVGLVVVNSNLTTLRPVVEPFTVAYNTKSLLFSNYWKNVLQPKHEQTVDVPLLNINISMAELIFAGYVATSWLQTVPCTNRFTNISLTDDVFALSDGGTRAKPMQPVLKTLLSGCTIHRCFTEAAEAATVSLESLHVSLIKYDNGQDCSTQLLSCPVDVSGVHNGQFLQQQRQTTSCADSQMLSLTWQIPLTSNIQAPAVLFIKIAGLYGCCDPALYEWLTYGPVSKASSSEPSVAVNYPAGSPLSPVVVDMDLAQASLPVATTTSRGSCSDTNGPAAVTTSHTPSQQLPVAVEVLENQTEDPAVNEQTQVSTWGHKLAELFPLVKIMEIQVAVSNWIFCLPVSPMKSVVPSEPIVNLHRLFTDRSLADMLIVCCPELTVTSSGHGHSNAFQTVPIKTLKHSIANERLPWTAKLDKLSIYSVHQSERMLYILKPTSLCATLAVTTKYHCPPVDTLSLLGLCIHADMETVEMALSNSQIQLIYCLISKCIASVGTLYANTQQILDLYALKSTPSSSIKQSPNGTAETQNLQKPQSTGQMTTTASSFAESPNLFGGVTNTLTSESMSLDVMLTEVWQGGDGVQLSLWLQWTLMKFVLKIYSGNGALDNMVRVISEFEDITTAVDIHQIYSKVKCNIGVVNISHHIKRDNAWQPGDHEGMILSCGDTLTRNVVMFSQKSWRRFSSANTSVFTPVSPGNSTTQPQPTDQRHGFLNVVFTRALKASACRRLAMSGDSDAIPGESDDGDFLSEVCLNIQPCDVIFNGRVVACLLNTFTNISDPKSSATVSHTVSHEPSSQDVVLPYITSRILPLIYITANGFRLFVPALNPCSSGGSSRHSHPNGKEDIQHFQLPADGDVCVLQFSSLTVIPKAVNPLGRLVVDKVSYMRAVHTGLTGQPGADIEDRQYQIDIKALSLSTGCGKQLLSVAGGDVDKIVGGSVNENPALAWNMLLPQLNKVYEVHLIPVVSGFDLRTIFAPAIVSATQSASLHLICGHSIEVNATSDLDLFLSIDQLRLLYNILDSNIYQMIQGLSPSPHATSGKQSSTSQITENGTVLDSGLGSESSVALPRSVTLSQDTVRPPGHENDSENVTSLSWLETWMFDMLLTAGRISLMLYDSEFSNGETNMESVNGKPDEPADIPRTCLIPLLHTSFSQPHSFIVCCHDNQRIELSCYDVTVHGPPAVEEMSTLLDEFKIIPEPLDFPVLWIETRPGKVDPNSGIPTCLYNLRITDYLTSAADITLDIGRPLRLNASVEKLKQVLSTVERIQNALLPTSSSEQPPYAKHSSKQVTVDVNGSGSSLLSYASCRHHVSMSTVQLVLAMDCKGMSRCAGLKLAVTGIKTGFFMDQKDDVPGALCQMFIGDLLVKTCWNTRTSTLLGPFSTCVDVSASLESHSGGRHGDQPRIVTTVECGTMPLHVGQDNVLALELIANALQKLSSELYAPSSSTETVNVATSVTPHKQKSSMTMDDQTEDDLKTGNFEYVTEERIDALPSVNEVLFHTDVTTGCASMTWCYKQLRVINSLSVMPVPFSLSAEYDSLENNLLVPCILQYSADTSHSSFTNYAKFYLSENTVSEVSLPGLGDPDQANVVTADVWRVLILNKLVNKNGQEVCFQDEVIDKSRPDGKVAPLVSPMALAVSLRVNSVFVPDLVPAVQLTFKSDSVSIGLVNNIVCSTGRGFPSTEPFRLVNNKSSHEVIVLHLNKMHVTAAKYDGCQAKLQFNVDTTTSCDILEYRNLTMRPVFANWSIDCSVGLQRHNEQPKLTIDADLGKVYFNVGQAVIYIVSKSVGSWLHIHDIAGYQPTMEYYIVCNNTQQSIHFGQTDTDECISVGPGEAFPYTWRTHKTKQSLQIAVDGVSLSSSPQIDVDKKGSTCVNFLTPSDRKMTLIVRIDQLTNCQKQITVSGQLSVGNLLSRSLQVKLQMLSSPTEIVTNIDEQNPSPSFVVDPSSVRAIKIRWKDSNTSWSSDISIASSKSTVGHLTKVPSVNKSDPVHVWCHVYCHQHDDISEFLVAFLPLFVVQTQLPTSLLMKVETARLKSQMFLELDGRGLEKQLYLSGGDITHTITFQLSETMLASSPVVSLSSDTIEQVCRKAVTISDVHELWKSWKRCAPGSNEEVWPYNALDKSCSQNLVHLSAEEAIVVPRDPASETMRRPVVEDQVFEQPNIDLQVTLTQRWPGLNTLLIDVAPHCLVINECNLELALMEISGKTWRLPAGKTFAAPAFEEDSFITGVVLSGHLHTSDTVHLRNEEFAESPYRSQSEPFLYCDGHIQLDVPIRNDGEVIQLCCLSVHSTYHQRMRVVTIRERFSFVNQTPYDLDAYCTCVPMYKHKTNMLDGAHALVRLRSSTGNHVGVPQSLLLWNVLGSTSSFAASSYAQYVCFKFADTTKSTSGFRSPSATNTTQWSYPVRLRVASVARRCTLALPYCADSGSSTKACCLSVQSDNAVVYITFAPDAHPAVELHNNCDVPLYYGQAVTDAAGFEDVTVQEEVELLSDLPRVVPFSSMHYTPPLVNSKFPEIGGPGISDIKLHLAGSRVENNTVWSHAVDLGFEHSIFVNIPEISDVKVSSSRIGHTLHVSIDPVSRAEVSAKEIRNRIKSQNVGGRVKETTITTVTTSPSSPLKSAERSRSRSVSESGRSPSQHSGVGAKTRDEATSLLLVVNCLCRQIGVIVLDDRPSSGVVHEFLCLTIDRAGFTFEPKLDVVRSTTSLIRHMQHVRVSALDMQIDNLMYGKANYDFPVVVAAQTRQWQRQDDDDELNLREKLKRLLCDSLINLSIELFSTDDSQQRAVQTVSIAVKPLVISVEDVYIFDILKIIDSIIPTVPAVSKSSGITRRHPAHISAMAASLSSPVCMQHLCIDTIDVMISVHASLKLYIASDNAPLSLGQFEQRNLCTTSQQLVHAVVMHYAACALYRAGLLVGSLEILGNPTGLMRSIGNGVSDMISLPYQGLTRGPGAFLDGVRRGSGSLLWHLSTGTLTSITNFASSVSRNMERLSLDSDHIERNQNLRRRKPSGVSDGLKNGLSGLGLSILGAIAGIADQPLQVFARSPSHDPNASQSGRASGVMSGIGKGLVGAVTKPIGGAAEFVSQTSLGILHQVGLSQGYKHRRQCVEWPIGSFTNSLAKYHEKLLSYSSDVEALAAVNGRQLTQPTAHRQSSVTPCQLVLTCDVINMISVDDDVQIRTFTIVDIDCQPSQSTGRPSQSTGRPSCFYIVLARKIHSAINDEQELVISRDRIAAFIDGVARTNRSEAEDDNVIKYEFDIDSGDLDHFLSQFRIAKNCAIGDGFAV